MDRDVLRSLAVLVGAIAQVAVAAVPAAFGIGADVATRSDALRTPITPPGWAFSIWGLLFAWCGVFAIWQCTTAGRTSALSRRVGWPAVIVLACNTAWQAYVPWRGLDFGSVAIILTGTTASLAIVWQVRRSSLLSAKDRWLIATPLLLLGGWLTAATFVNFAATMQGYGPNVWPGQSTSTYIVLLCIVSVLANAAIANGGGWAFALPIVWAFVAIATRQFDERTPIAITAAIFAAVLALIALLIRRPRAALGPDRP